MKSEKYPEVRAQYTEALLAGHEIEFSYKDYDYCIQPDDEGFSVWKVAKGGNSGPKIAEAKTVEDVFELNCFEGKTVLEIEDDVTDAIIF